jgi:hypothetical protein
MTLLADSPAVPTMGLEPRYWRARREPAAVEAAPSEAAPAAASFQFETGRRVDEATGAMRRRVMDAKPRERRHFSAYLALPIMLGLTVSLWFGWR